MQFPITFTRPPLAHQLEVLERAKNDEYFALFWEMGSGKTTEAILWARLKYQKESDVMPTLIFSPLATLWNWQEEFVLNAPQYIHKNTAIAWHKSGDSKKKLEAFKSKIVILNYEALDSDTMLEACHKHNARMIICDEAHALKNPKSKRVKKLLGFTDKAKYRIALTGTPVLNNYLDLWGIFRFLSGGKEFPWHDFFVFRSKFFVDKNAGMPKTVYFPNWQPHAKTSEEVSQLIAAKSSRITKEECLKYLPPITRSIQHVELGKEQAKAYKEMEAQLIAQVQKGECAASNALVKTLRLLQIVSGHLPVEKLDQRIYDPTNVSELEAAVSYIHKFPDVPRLERLSEILEEISGEHKTIIWSTFRETYGPIKDILSTHKLPFATLTGDTVDKREEMARFQTDKNCRVMLANPQAGGVGVNLTASSYSIYYSRNYKLLDFLQSEARNHRGGSEIHEKITQIHLVTRGTIDEAVVQALLRKEDFADNILDKIRSHAINLKSTQ